MYKEIKQKTSSCSNIHEVLETILWGFLTRDRIGILVIQFRMMQLVKKIPRSNQLICLVEGIIEDLGADTGFRRGGGRDMDMDTDLDRDMNTGIDTNMDRNMNHLHGDRWAVLWSRSRPFWPEP